MTSLALSRGQLSLRTLDRTSALSVITASTKYAHAFFSKMFQSYKFAELFVVKMVMAGEVNQGLPFLKNPQEPQGNITPKLMWSVMGVI